MVETSRSSPEDQSDHQQAHRWAADRIVPIQQLHSHPPGIVKISNPGRTPRVLNRHHQYADLQAQQCYKVARDVRNPVKLVQEVH